MHSDSKKMHKYFLLERTRIDINQEDNPVKNKKRITIQFCYPLKFSVLDNLKMERIFKVVQNGGDYNCTLGVVSLCNIRPYFAKYFFPS